MTAKLRVALAGAGMISRHHLIAWHKCEDAQVVAIADPKLDAAQGRAREFGIEQVLDDAEVMLDTVRPDAIDIASPVETHVALAQAASRRGVAVLCQKPLAPTLTQARSLAAAAARVPFMAHENWRFRAPYRIARNWIRQGRIGAVHRFAISTRSSGLISTGGEPAPAIARQPFFTAMPRLMILESLIHHLDVARALCGELTVVAARTTHSTEAIAGDDRAIVLLEGSGCIGAVTGDYAVPGLPPRSSDAVEIVGSAGTLTFDGETLTLSDAACNAHAERFERADIYQSGFDNAIAHFMRGVQRGEPFETSLEDNLKTFALVEAAYASAAATDEGAVAAAGAA